MAFLHSRRHLLLFRWLALCGAIGAIVGSVVLFQLWPPKAVPLQDKKPCVAADATEWAGLPQRFTDACVVAYPGGVAQPPLNRPLSSRWDRVFPGQGGRAIYDVDLPAVKGSQPMALLFYRVGNQAQVRVNGVPVEHWGELSNPAYDAAKEAHLVVLPAGLLRADRLNRLTVEVTIQPLRWGGLSEFDFGTQAQLVGHYESNQLWRNRASLVFAVSMALMGILAAALWWQQREPLFGCFALAAGLAVVRNLDRILPTAPLPWPMWGVVVNATFAASLGLMIRFALLASEQASKTVMRLVHVATGAAVLLGIGSMLLGAPRAWTVGLGLLAVTGALALVPTARAAWRDHSVLAWALLIAAGAAVGAGVYDIRRARLGFGTDPSLSLTSYAVFLFVLVMAGMVAERYGRAVRRYQQLSGDLAQRVAEREADLRVAYEALQQQQTQQAVATERQRLMRDIHDGVGAQLVGLVSLASAGPEPSVAIAAQARLALEELHLAVDALAPVEGDLAVVLGTLRYRLSARLQAAGLEVDWDVEPLPPLANLPPSAVAQIQRILLEAITNVVKHARANRIVLQARGRVAAPPGQPATISLVLVDNGCGFDSAHRFGQGLLNMKARAEAIGASFNVASTAGAGTTVRLDWVLTEE